MANLISFVNSFLSYLLLFGVSVGLIAVACFIGIKWRKSKNEKEAAEAMLADVVVAEESITK